MKGLCLNGCERPAQVRGRCRSHYNAFRKRELVLGRWTSRRDSIGTARRIRALVAIGYTQAELAREVGMHESWICKLAKGDRAQANSATVTRVTEVYNRLSMTPGSSDRARRHALRHGWPPPLAWEEDEIDDPTATADFGSKVTVSFLECYREMRDLGYNDLQIVGRWDIHPESLLRQLDRYHLKPSPELVTMASRRKHKASRAAS